MTLWLKVIIKFENVNEKIKKGKKLEKNLDWRKMKKRRLLPFRSLITQE